MCRYFVMNYNGPGKWDLRKAHKGMFGLFKNVDLYFDAIYLNLAY